MADIAMARPTCEHHRVWHVRAGEPLPSVPVCSICHEVDWPALREDVEETLAGLAALAERRRLAWLSACRDRSRIRHEMWKLHKELDEARTWHARDVARYADLQAQRDSARGIAAALEAELAQVQGQHAVAYVAGLRLRAEQAETQRDELAEKLRAGITSHWTNIATAREERAAKAEAALARVEALCEQLKHSTWGQPTTSMVARDVRAAITQPPAAGGDMCECGGWPAHKVTAHGRRHPDSPHSYAPGQWDAEYEEWWGKCFCGKAQLDPVHDHARRAATPPGGSGT